MPEANFPVRDLFRRRPQGILILASMTLCVASTLFLLLYAQNLGYDFFSQTQMTLTVSFGIVFSRYIWFLDLLVLATGAVITSFLASLMMSQRTRDIGLMSAIGCPNDLIFGYLMTELLIVTVIGCTAGVVLGVVAALVSVPILNVLGLDIQSAQINAWLVVLVFVAYFVFALVLGMKPILDATKLGPSKALSVLHYAEITENPPFKAVSKSNLILKMALRNLSRRKKTSIRAVICLTSVVILTTVALGGVVIANQTTQSWIERAIGRDMWLVGHQNMLDQYELLLSGSAKGSDFNYEDPRYQLSSDVLDYLNGVPEIVRSEGRLVVKEEVRENRSYIIDPDTLATISIGDNRSSESIVVGIDPEKTLGNWLIDGRFLKPGVEYEAMIGDSLAQQIFSMPLNQSVYLLNNTFDIPGVCIDPLNEGYVTYISLERLENITNQTEPNVVFFRLYDASDPSLALSKIRDGLSALNPSLGILDLDEILARNLNQLTYMWSGIMIVSLFSLGSVSLCLTGYVLLVWVEQREEFGIMRALALKVSAAMEMTTMQNLLILLSSYGAGIALGIMVTLLILIPEPVVTWYMIVEISMWLLAAFILQLVLCVYPVFRVLKRPIHELLTSF